MPLNQPSTADRRSIAVSSPGGPARQFRVQVYCPANGQWRHWAGCSDQTDASRRARQCLEGGQQARVVVFAISPAAA